MNWTKIKIHVKRTIKCPEAATFTSTNATPEPIDLCFANRLQPVSEPFQGHELDWVGVVVIHHQCRPVGPQCRIQYKRNPERRYGYLVKMKPRQTEKTGQDGDEKCNCKDDESADDAENSVGVLQSNQDDINDINYIEITVHTS